MIWCVVGWTVDRGVPTRSPGAVTTVPSFSVSRLITGISQAVAVTSYHRILKSLLNISWWRRGSRVKLEIGRSPCSSPTQDQFLSHALVTSLINWGVKPHQNRPSIRHSDRESNFCGVSNYRLCFTMLMCNSLYWCFRLHLFMHDWYDSSSPWYYHSMVYPFVIVRITDFPHNTTLLYLGRR